MTELISVWTIYDRPKDFRYQFVARRSYINNQSEIVNTNELLFGETLDEVREQIPAGFYRVARCANDDPVIVEVWI